MTTSPPPAGQRKKSRSTPPLAPSASHPSDEDGGAADSAVDDAQIAAGRVIGLTGNIACGKSTVATMLRAKGYAVVDADQIARQVVEPGQLALAQISKAFGPSVLRVDGGLDRELMRNLVFKDPHKRKTLESIMHPAIAAASMAAFKTLFAAGHGIVFYEASLLVETGRHSDFEGLLVVTCPESAQRERLMRRDGIDSELADNMVRAQMPQHEKTAQADWVVENDGDLRALESSLDAALGKILGVPDAK